MDGSPKSAPTAEAARATEIPSGYFAPRPDARVVKSESEALDVARRFAESIAPGASARDRERRLPFHELRNLSGTGLLGITVPKEYGGLAVSTRTLVEVFKILSAADPAVGQIPQNHFVFVRALDVEGSPWQKSYFLDRVLRGDQFGNALSERGTKTVLEFKTRITRKGGALRLNGAKFYCTGALFARWIPVFALDESDKLVIVFVPQGAPGVTVFDDWSGVGQRTTASGTTRFEDVEVATENIVPIWRAYERPSTLGAFAQILHVAIDVGIATAALDDAADFVRDRSRPWAESGLSRASDEPHIIKHFGQLHIALEAADALLQRAARMFDELDGDAISEEAATQVSLSVASAKSFASNVVIEITNALFELSGTASMDEKYNLDRHWRNARIHTLHDPARWKQFHVGNWFLNGIAPPRVYS